jgi:hypothetical protein
MKMKRLFNFFAIAAIVAIGFTGCSSEEQVDPVVDPNGGGTGPVVKGEETYATFQFEADGKPLTRTSTVTNDQGESVTISSLRITVFDGLTKEKDTIVNPVPSDGKVTFKVTSGPKNLFVLANYPARLNSLLGAETGSQQLSDWNPEFTLDADPANAIGEIDSISHLFKPAFALSNRADSTAITLTANITESGSKDGNSPNNIKVNIKRMVGKIYVSQTPDSGPGGTGETLTLDSTGIITTSPLPTYRVMNILASLYPFQKWNGTTPETPYYLTPYSGYESKVARGVTTSTPADTLGVGSGTGTTDIPIVLNSTSYVDGSGQAYYVTENVTMEKRLATFAAVKAQFTPTKNKHITGVTFNNTSGGKFTQIIATANAATGTFYVLKKLGTTTATGVTAETIIAGSDALDVAKKIVYHLENPTVEEKPLSAYTSLVTQVKLDEYVATYATGYCYYRLDVGNGVMPNIDYGVRRNTRYLLNIDAYNTLGAVKPADLIGEPGEKLKAETWLTVTIGILPWDPASSGQVI